MVRILVVDDDQEVLLALKEGLPKYDDSFAVSMAGDGMIAIEKLKKESVSLVVTDLKMPRIDGLQLLTYINDNYPDIPAIAITGYSSPEVKKRVQGAGAVGYFAKPVKIGDLARSIIKALSRESEGGRLRNVSSGTFLQLIELEQKTCTIRMADNETGAMGVLFFKDGELLDARCEGWQGLDAAYRIFSWDEVALSIQNICAPKKNVINCDLQPIILEAMRQKDEGRDGADQGGEATVIDEIDLIEIVEEPEERQTGRGRSIEQEMASLLGANSGIEKISPVESWKPLLEQTEDMAGFFSLGRPKAAYLVREGEKDIGLLPGDAAVVFELVPRCNRDRLLAALSQLRM